MALAVVAVGVLEGFVPGNFRLFSPWVFSVFLICFLVVLIIGDPGRIDRQRRWLRITTGTMIGFITVVTAGALVRVTAGIIGHASWASAGELLAIGGTIWLINVIAFALWFWDLDAGGAAARAAGSEKVPIAFLFPEMTNPDRVPAGWYPQFVDYLALSFNTALAFGPADVSAIRRWAKLMMVSESLMSLVLAALCIARASTFSDCAPDAVGAQWCRRGQCDRNRAPMDSDLESCRRQVGATCADPSWRCDDHPRNHSGGHHHRAVDTHGGRADDE